MPQLSRTRSSSVKRKITKAKRRSSTPALKNKKIAKGECKPMLTPRTQKTPSQVTKENSLHSEKEADIDSLMAFCRSYNEPKVQGLETDITFRPHQFLRTHSKNDDPADVQTQVWECAFEPSLSDPNQTTGLVATCGGSSICLIRAEDGEVVLKYLHAVKTQSGKMDSNLYALAWTTVPRRRNVPTPTSPKSLVNVLASGGAKSRIILLDTEAGVLYGAFSTMPGKSNAVIASLRFHPHMPTWLFCGHEDGHIQLWDIGFPNPPVYGFSPVKVGTFPKIEGVRDIYNMVYSKTHDLLVGGYDGGLYVWDAGVDKLKENGVESAIRTEFILPEHVTDDDDDDDLVVDSVRLLREDLVAVKCALRGLIYVFSISKVMEKRTLGKDKNVYKAEVSEQIILKLRWSNTDNFYMNIGVDKTSCLLVCGDDKGALWVYDLSPYVTESKGSPLTDGPMMAPLEPDTILSWPVLDDPEVDKARKLKVTAHDIIVDRCTVSPGGDYIVAVTSNNMVCFWTRKDIAKRITRR